MISGRFIASLAGPIDTAPNSLTDPADPDARISAWRLGLLEELAEIGMDVARTVRKQAIAQKQLQDVGDRAGVAEIIGRAKVAMNVPRRR